ncbi:hypothetical protein IF1G_03136 [Cordyceps javanica]|uniref:Uncharacterized protein n=1 Tax=Cordyceps javanica TaxID=43265 RepID=A0A545V6S1_9HYPO|nr:hypothetical protein IF1G_03136 [Cordyceps javanica]
MASPTACPESEPRATQNNYLLWEEEGQGRGVRQLKAPYARVRGEYSSGLHCRVLVASSFSLLVKPNSGYLCFNPTVLNSTGFHYP